jgi:hypothetical protein
VNHNQDIDDGLEEYREAEQRQMDEALWRSNPSYFDWLAELGQFEAKVVHSVTLTSVKVEDRCKRPFSYWSGYAVVSGRYEGSNDTLGIRWDQNGAILEITRGVTA